MRSANQSMWFAMRIPETGEKLELAWNTRGHVFFAEFPAGFFKYEDLTLAPLVKQRPR
jgi:hypothetical protein